MDKIKYKDTEEVEFFRDLVSDMEAGFIKRIAPLAVIDEHGNETVAVVTGNGDIATVDGTIFGVSDWEECGRLEFHAPDPDDPIDMAAIAEL